MCGGLHFVPLLQQEVVCAGVVVLSLQRLLENNYTHLLSLTHFLAQHLLEHAYKSPKQEHPSQV